MTSRKNHLNGYERINAIGKGAFGTAVLYKRLSDKRDVVIKEIFLSDMTDTEKQLAFNEAKVLAALNHPNIIRYMGSFEKEGSLLIEMEYADNGNLAQLINLRKERKKMFKEKDILQIMSQITSGISYMHSHKILHRDLKAANIFLNKNGTLKIGDFGISKILNTRVQAQTVVGTPYYLSPEMCEGKDYNEKSDIWAVGCILYELACFHKPFEAQNLSILVQRISACEYEDIPDIYSKNLWQLIRDILQKDYINRPSSQHIHDVIIPSFLECSVVDSNSSRKHSLNSLTIKNTNGNERSVLYQLNGFGENLSLSPLELPIKKIISLSTSTTHFIAVTLDNLVYTWGNDTFGQLAHGTTDIIYRKHPTCIEYLRGKSIIMCAAGEHFSVFLNKNGLIFTCGDGRQGCLGHNHCNYLLRPTLIDSLITKNIAKIVCGAKHALALTTEAEVYSWGSSTYGQLGIGHEKFCCTPTAIKLPNDFHIIDIFAGSNSSALLDTNGRVLVCGDNTYNKLGVQQEKKITNFKVLRILKDKLVKVALGSSHTILVSSGGKVIGMGRNTEGQLGLGNCNNHSYPRLTASRIPDKIIMVSCGPTYTVVGTSNNVVYFWGTYFKDKISELAFDLNKFSSPMMPKTNTFLQKIPKISAAEIDTRDLEEKVPELVKNPKSLLALYASNDKLNAGQKIWLEKLEGLSNSLMVLINTTASPPLDNRNQNMNASFSGVHRSGGLSQNTAADWMDTNLDYSALTTLPNTAELQ